MKGAILGLSLAGFAFGFVLVEATSSDWDVLIFTARWPNTACTQWRHKSKDNTCSLPKNVDSWTIHGLWPTKYGTKGPSGCNSSWPYNDTAIEIIKPRLEQSWINVENNTKLDSLWRHEWNKHGTCAAVLPQLASEYLYFSQGLNWIDQYDFASILGRKQISPAADGTAGYLVQDIFDAVKDALGKNPIIECVVDKVSKESLISEIRVCFDKQLQLTDCDLVKGIGGKHYKLVGNLHTNCNLKKPVVYLSKSEGTVGCDWSEEWPGDVDLIRESALENLLNTRKFLVMIYTTVKLVMWATL